jgi:hypothetical protein
VNDVTAALGATLARVGLAETALGTVDATMGRRLVRMEPAADRSRR